MTEDNDRLLQRLAYLPAIEPDMRWETHVRARCHSAISRRESRKPRPGTTPPGMGLTDLAAVVALCIYLAAVLAEVARLAALV
jgi:hypothetical protein